MHKRQYIKTLIDQFNPEIICLQETWLLEHAITPKLSDIDDNYIPIGVSGMDEKTGIIRGRPKGGCAIMWHQNITKCVTEVQTDSKRVCAITVKLDNGDILLVINCYMPNDNMNKININEEFMDTCMEIGGVIDKVVHDEVIIAADWNTDFKRNTAQSMFLKQYMDMRSVKWSFNHDQSNKEDTFYCFNGSGSSCIDYFLLSEKMHDAIVTSYVVWHGINLSPHHPVLLSVNVKSALSGDMDTCDGPNHGEKDPCRKLAWHRAKEVHINNYHANIDTIVNNIVIPRDLLECNNLICTNEEHKHLIDSLGDSIVQCCISAGDRAIPKIRPKKAIPKWGDRAQPAKDTALFWHSIWLSCNRPNTGWVCEIRRKTRAQYHRIVKELQRNETLNRCECMAEAILSSNNRDFWKEAKRFKPKKRPIPKVIDGVTGEENISELFAENYRNLYNSVPYDVSALNRIKETVNERMSASDVDVTVSVKDIQDAIVKLKSGKHDGSKGLESDHLIHSSESFHKILALFISFCFRHSHMAESISQATIISIPKDCRGSNVCSNNYRGICLCSSIIKLVDLIMLSKCGHTLDTSDLQFAYKPNMSTTMCTTVLKEVVHHYNSNGSDVYVCMLDASKAFDRIKYDKLFDVLLQRNFPPVFINMLMNSYIGQNIRAKWGQSASSQFHGVNGIRQGGVISPILFIVYMDELISRLEKCQAGCWIGHRYFGCLVFADDMNLLCPSGTGLQRMLNICAEFGVEYSINFNETKTKCIKFGGNEHVPSVQLNNQNLKWVNEIDHLGNMLDRNLKDSHDVLIKQQTFFSQVNIMVSDFGTVNCKIGAELFNKYCNSFYGSQAWDLRSDSVACLYRSWNKGIRRVLGLPYNSHCFLLPLLINAPPLKVQFMKRFVKMCCTMYKSVCKSVKLIFDVCLENATSLIRRNLFMVCQYFNVNINDVFNTGCHILDCERKEDECRVAEFVRELLYVRDNIVNLEGMERDEIEVMIQAASTM